MLEDGEAARWCLRWCSRYREPLLRSWPLEGEDARRGETEDCRRLLRRPRSSTSGSTIVGSESYVLAGGEGTAAPTDSDMARVGV